MKALVKLADSTGTVGIVDRPIPQCGSGEVLIRVSRASICGSDLHIYHGQLDCADSVILGHEFAGSIVKTAEDVHDECDYEVGDRIFKFSETLKGN